MTDEAATSTPPRDIGDLEHLRVSVSEEGVASVLMHRPPANALTREMADELDTVSAHVRSSPKIRVLVIASALDGFFMAGGDIHGYAELSPDGLVDLARHYRGVFRRVRELPVPTIAAIHGHTVGAGAELAVACHLRVAARDVAIGFAEVRLGGLPAAGGTQHLTRVVGHERALELMLTGRSVDADEALRIGLVGTVTDGRAIDAAHQLATTIAGMPPVAVRAITTCVRVGIDEGHEAGLRSEQAGLEAIAGTEEFASAVRAFVDRG